MTNAVLQNVVTPRNRAGYSRTVISVFVEDQKRENRLKALKTLALSLFLWVESGNRSGAGPNLMHFPSLCAILCHQRKQRISTAKTVSDFFLSSPMQSDFFCLHLPDDTI
jgi:hypothetical protein